MKAALAPELVLEVLDGIGDEQIVTFQSGIRERAIEQPSGRADEGAALYVFSVTRLFADKHDQRPRWTLTRDDLSRVAIEQASGAVRLAGGELFQRLYLQRFGL